MKGGGGWQHRHGRGSGPPQGSVQQRRKGMQIRMRCRREGWIAWG